MAISKAQHDELCVTYATLALFDGEAEITSDAIAALIKASGNEVEPYWPSLFAGLLGKSNKKILDLISSGGPSASAGAAAGGAAGGAAGAAAVEEEQVEEEEEANIGGGMDMFGGGSDY